MRTTIVVAPYVVLAVFMLAFARDRDAARASNLSSTNSMMSVQHMCGLYRGIVTTNSDPENRGRVKVQVPQAGVSGMWALPSAAGSSPPPAGTQVWIMFEAGESTRPVWFGAPPRGV